MTSGVTVLPTWASRPVPALPVSHFEVRRTSAKVNWPSPSGVTIKRPFAYGASVCSWPPAQRHEPVHVENPSRPRPSASYFGVHHGAMNMTQLSEILHSDPQILGGTPVFVGTRVPVQSLFDYLEGGETLDEFLRQFPSVSRDQAIAALDLARTTLLAGARSS